MSVLDELREALCKYSQTVEESQADYDVMQGFFETFDAFAAEHPTLIDLTTCNETCPAWHRGGVNSRDGLYDWCSVLFDEGAILEEDEAPTGQPCPVLEGRKP
jgi:hypothetical protein